MREIESKRGRREGEIMIMCRRILDGPLAEMGHQMVPRREDPSEFSGEDFMAALEEPLDLPGIWQKMVNCEYPDPMEFARDVRLAFKKALTCPPTIIPLHLRLGTTYGRHLSSGEEPTPLSDSQVVALAQEMWDAFEREFKAVEETVAREKEMRAREDEETAREVGGNFEGFLKGLQKLESHLRGSREGRGGGKGKGKRKRATVRGEWCRPKLRLGDAGKLALCKALGKFPEPILGCLARILEAHQPEVGRWRGEVVEVDLEDLDNDSLWALHCFASDPLSFPWRGDEEEISGESEEEEAEDGWATGAHKRLRVGVSAEELS